MPLANIPIALICLFFVMTGCSGATVTISADGDTEQGEPAGDADPGDAENEDDDRVDAPVVPACPEPGVLETAACPFTNSGPCPGYADMVRVIGTCHCVDIYENVVSLSQDCSPPFIGQNQDDYVADDHSLPPFVGCCGDDYSGHCRGENLTEQGVHYGCSLPGVKPSAYISWFQARRACENAGKALCESSVWSGGCKAMEQAWYPYGHVFEPCACSHAFSQGFGFATEDASVESGGSYPACESTAGALDMSGNVSEWSYEGEERYANAVSLGGSAQSGVWTALSCYPWPAGVNVSDAGPPVQGFRCCREFAPDRETAAGAVAAKVALSGEGLPCVDTGITDTPDSLQAFGDTVAYPAGDDGMTMVFHTAGQRDDIVLPPGATKIVVSGHRSMSYVLNNALYIVIDSEDALPVSLPEGASATAADLSSGAFAALAADEYLFVAANGFSARITSAGMTELTPGGTARLAGTMYLAVNDAGNWLALDRTRMLLCHNGQVRLLDIPFDFSLRSPVADGRDYMVIMNGTDTAVYGIDAATGAGSVRMTFDTCGFDSITGLAVFNLRLYAATDHARLLSLPLDGSGGQLRHFVPALPLGVSLPVLSETPPPVLHLAAVDNAMHVLTEYGLDDMPLCSLKSLQD